MQFGSHTASARNPHSVIQTIKLGAVTPGTRWPVVLCDLAQFISYDKSWDHSVPGPPYWTTTKNGTQRLTQQTTWELNHWLKVLELGWIVAGVSWKALVLSTMTPSVREVPWDPLIIMPLGRAKNVCISRVLVSGLSTHETCIAFTLRANTCR